MDKDCLFFGLIVLIMLVGIDSMFVVGIIEQGGWSAYLEGDMYAANECVYMAVLNFMLGVVCWVIFVTGKDKSC